MDNISKERRSENMRQIRSKDTTPEKIVRSMVHRLGYRFRLHGGNLPGKPDLVFASRQKVIYVHGCFWHQHNDPKCKIARIPKSNPGFWIPKLERTKERDQQHLKNLKKLGWKALVIWECQISDAEKLSKRIIRFLD